MSGVIDGDISENMKRRSAKLETFVVKLSTGYECEINPLDPSEGIEKLWRGLIGERFIPAAARGKGGARFRRAATAVGKEVIKLTAKLDDDTALALLRALLWEGAIKKLESLNNLASRRN